jgi:septum formation protein
LVLASASPQRSAILEMLGIAFEQLPARVEEVRSGPPEAVVIENALRKARAAGRVRPGRLVLGVDTEVFLAGELFGKPRDAAQARAYLKRLSGCTHEVFSGIALLRDGEEHTAAARTAVTFRRLDERFLGWYLDTGEWRERAGGYAVQGRGAALVEGIDGDYWNVVGLPVPLLLECAPGLLGA